jgi:transposase
MSRRPGGGGSAEPGRCVSQARRTRRVSVSEVGRSIAAAGRRQLRTLLEARAEQYDRQAVVSNRWLPGSQMGSPCGQHNGNKELSIQEWQCPSCAVVHDRDSNATHNILAEAFPCAA